MDACAFARRSASSRVNGLTLAVAELNGSVGDGEGVCDCRDATALISHSAESKALPKRVAATCLLLAQPVIGTLARSIRSRTLMDD